VCAVLLILRAQREGVKVEWNTDRTKQAVVNRIISDKIKSLNVIAALRMKKEQAAARAENVVRVTRRI